MGNIHVPPPSTDGGVWMQQKQETADPCRILILLIITKIHQQLRGT